MRLTSTLLVLLAAAVPLSAGRAQAPTGQLQAARIASGAAIDVQTAPAAVTMQIAATSPFGLSSVRFGLRSPSRHQTIVGEQFFAPNPVSFNGLVQTRLGGGGLGAHGLNLYSEAGTWTLDFIDVCDGFRICARTSGAALAALVSPATVTVSNHGTPVSSLPRVMPGAILTPSVAETVPFPNEPNVVIVPSFQLSVTGTAAAPGIVQAEARFAPPANPPCAGFSTPPVVLRMPVLSAPTTQFQATLNGGELSCFNTTSLVGVYTLDRLRVADEAGNVVEITDPARLAKLFPGGTTVTVTAPAQ